MNEKAKDLIEYHKEHGVVTQGYSTLGNTPLGHHASADILHGNLTSSIAKAHNVSTVQVALKWVVSHGIAAVTKSSNPVRAPDRESAEARIVIACRRLEVIAALPAHPPPPLAHAAGAPRKRRRPLVVGPHRG